MSGRRYSGNIRELRNLIERATLLADGDVIETSHLTDLDEDLPVALVRPDGAFSLDEIVDLVSLESRYIDWAKHRVNGDFASLAGQLGISQRTLYRKLRGVA